MPPNNRPPGQAANKSPVTMTTNPFDDDKLREECGVFGIFGHEDSAALTTLGLHALQHRGQEAAGIVAYDSDHFHMHRAKGHVGDTLNSPEVIARLPGHMAIGHVRYSTSGDSIMRNVQPLFADFEFGGLAVAQNGNLTNARALRAAMVRDGRLFQSTTDTEVIIHLVAKSGSDTLVGRVTDAIGQLEGAYSMVLISRKKVIGVRDPLGVRPLVLGRLDASHVLASETCALDIIGAEFLRDVEPGEMVVLDDNGVESLRPFRRRSSRFCIFEHIYFARPDSRVEGRGVYSTRKSIGAELAREAGVPADVVVPVPDSGVPAAMGYAEAAGLPFELGIVRNHYVGRTFIEPADQIRHLGVRLKHSPNRDALDRKRVVLVDDSIVRGTTSTKIVEMIRNAGAREVHLRISSPPTGYSCFYGIDTPEREQLLAARHDIEGMTALIGVDSLAFLSIDGLHRAMGEAAGRNAAAPQFCDACFTGDYPTGLTDFEEGSIGSELSLLEEDM